MSAPLNEPSQSAADALPSYTDARKQGAVGSAADPKAKFQDLGGGSSDADVPLYGPGSVNLEHAASVAASEGGGAATEQEYGQACAGVDAEPAGAGAGAGGAAGGDGAPDDDYTLEHAHTEVYDEEHPGKPSSGKPKPAWEVGAAAAFEALVRFAKSDGAAHILHAIADKTAPTGGEKPTALHTGISMAAGAASKAAAKAGDAAAHAQGGTPVAAEASARAGAGGAGAGAGAGGQGPVTMIEKLIGLAMAEAAKRSDKAGGGSPEDKQKAIRAAASTILKLVRKYGASAAGPQGARGAPASAGAGSGSGGGSDVAQMVGKILKQVLK